MKSCDSISTSKRPGCRIVACAADVARRRVRLTFGGPTQIAELSRESRGVGAWDSTVSDLRYAGRQIRRRPMFAATAIATLALGLGVTTVMVAIVDAVLIRPLPFADADRLYSLYELNSRANIGRTRAAALNFLDWKAQSRAFSDMAGHIGTGFSFTGRGDADFALGSARHAESVRRPRRAADYRPRVS